MTISKAQIMPHLHTGGIAALGGLSALAGSPEAAQMIANYYAWQASTRKPRSQQIPWRTKGVSPDAVLQRIQDAKDRYQRQDDEELLGRIGADTFDPPTDWTPEQPVDDNEDFARTCRHEVGHATVVLACGGQIIEIAANDNGSGHVRFGGVPERDLPTVSIAGYKAAGDLSGLFSDGCGSDCDQLHRELRASGVEGSDEDLRAFAYSTLEPIVDDIFCEHWRFRQECFAALLERGKLSGDEAHAIWDRCNK